MLTQAQWQFLWDKATDTTVRDWLFELLTEDGFDVQHGRVVKLGYPSV
ncbi:MAG: hypothetical protein WAN12_20435 [Candidatus Acidiferrum sp.]